MPNMPNRPKAKRKQKKQTLMKHLFSWFRQPVTNTSENAAWTTLEAYRHIMLDLETLTATHEYRRLLSLAGNSPQAQKEARLFKARWFSFCTFSGRFPHRRVADLQGHSGLLCMDFDHIGSPQEAAQAKSELFALPEFRSELCFISPSGDGVKWVIAIDTTLAPHDMWFEEVALHVRRTMGLTADRSGRDISRCCFLPHDSSCLARSVGGMAF